MALVPEGVHQPSKGRIVFLVINGETGLPLGPGEHVAIVTDVGETYINVAVIPDGFGPLQLIGVTSVPYQMVTGNYAMSWRWPPRV